MPDIHRNTAADNAIRAAAVVTVSGLAALAARISYQHMLLLAERHGEHGIDAHAFPLTVDGLDLIGVLVLLADRRTHRRSGPLPWTVLTIGTLASLTANIAVAPNNLVARAISGWTAIALLAAAKMLSHLFEPQPVAGEPTPAISRGETTPVAIASTGSTPPAEIPSTGGIARRLPTTPGGLARWHAIWQATRHLPKATKASAAEHSVSVRQLQFIRAAGEAGHLDTPPPVTSIAEINPGTQPAEPNRHNAFTRATV